MTYPHGMFNADFISTQEIRESNARSYPRRIPIAIKKAKGIFVTDVEGTNYYDCLSGAGTLALGHNHPIIKEAIRNVLENDLPLHALDIMTPIKNEFIEELFSSLPTEFASRAKIQFCGPTGADAVEAAIKLVKTATGSRSIFSFHGAYHGMTHGALSLTGNLGPKQSVSNLMPDVHFLPYPYPYRCPFGQGSELSEQISQHYIEHLLDDPESGITKPAGLIMEIIQGEGGVIPAPDNWIRKIRSITKKRKIPLIVDEVQTGFGRTGKLFAFEHAEIIPDVLILSKAIGGSLPLSVVVYDKDLDQWNPGAHAGTFRGNQMAMATGTATIKYIRANNLEKHAENMGDRFMSHLKEIQHSSSCIGEIRGKGLMIGIEIVNKQLQPNALNSYPPHSELARQIQQECLKKGLIVELGGRFGSVVRFLPPLVITEEQVDAICEIFAKSIQDIEIKL
ncbi:aspartate aminotransferase family protein [Shimazuella kribbensis]|uniref:aspartate aminotransferase family protein n=1 Tax=Shimazuella kribbensis TaxID=139808 RepID=UPI000429E2C2|nr:aspartate aminotransferase family protein [Shimazuella kribbensis]